MKNYWILFFPLILSITACNQKDKEPAKKFFSVRSLIEAQIAHVDTSLYSIRKIISIDTIQRDTTFINRENFREAAKDFLDIPDLADHKVSKRYKEETRYDETLKRAIFTYTPIDPRKEEIQKQELLIEPNIATGDKVTNIIIERVINNRNGFLNKKMLWQTDRSFLVTTTTQKPGEPEVITTTKVIWNEDDYK